MGYSFWETVQGHRLAETLIRTLPQIAENNTDFNTDAIVTEARKIREEIEALHHKAASEQAWQQYTIVCKRHDDINKIVSDAIMEGSEYVDSIEYSDYPGADSNQILIIMKRRQIY